MSREWAAKKRSGGWWMRCDREGCSTKSGIRPSDKDLPLEEFAARGWYIGHGYGDRCPKCVEESGGLATLIANMNEAGGATRPHAVMVFGSSSPTTDESAGGPHDR